MQLGVVIFSRSINYPAYWFMYGCVLKYFKDTSAELEFKIYYHHHSFLFILNATK